MYSRRTMQTILAATALLGATLFAAIPGTAQDELSAIDAAFETSRISLSRAIVLAEASGHGKAVHAKLSTNPGKPAYDVEILTGGSLLDIRIDSRTGILISSTRDMPDRDADDTHDHRTH